MKPVTIQPRTIAREAGYYAGCLFVALGANLFAIIHYHRPLSEFISQIGFVIVISLLLYLYIGIIRLLYFGIVSLFKNLRERINRKRGKAGSCNSEKPI